MNPELILLAILVVLNLALAIAVCALWRGGRRQSELAGRLHQQMEMEGRYRKEGMERLAGQMKQLTDQNYEQQIKLWETLERSTKSQGETLEKTVERLQRSNEQKLEQMRQTVDEKLAETLNQRLSSSFRSVSEQLSHVYQSLGEMKELSKSMTDHVKGLNRVLTNVKSRGTWAEVQLGGILEQTIPGLYETNVQTNPAYNGRVEFAVRIPGKTGEAGTYLPIDAKFPMEDYIRLTTAAEVGDAQAVEQARKALEARIRDEARLIRQYVSEPHTTPFAIMYLATEGLYAEVMASPHALAEKLQAEGILIAGPSTVTALLNSLAMGFRTMAINQKAEEVWRVLGAAKAQYEKFGALLAKAKKKVDEAGKVLDEADHRNQVIQKNLRKVESLEESQAESMLFDEAQ